MLRNENFILLVINTFSNFYVLPFFILFIATLFFFFLLDLTTMITNYFNTKHNYLNPTQLTNMLTTFLKHLKVKKTKKLYFKTIINLIF